MAAQLKQDELVSIKRAMELTGITSPGAFAAALKAHQYLKDAVVPADETFKRRIRLGAVQQYIDTRGQHAARDGAKAFEFRLSDAEAAEVAAWASAKYGREVVGTTAAQRAKAKAAKATNGAAPESDESDDESDDEA